MMDCLFLPPGCGSELTGTSSVYWLPSEGTGTWQTLEACAEAAQGRALALVLPAELCSALAVNLPTQKERLQRQALPYAVEELLAEDVEQLHLALGERLEDGRYRVIALRRSLLADWLQQLESLGLKVGAIYVDADLLPREGTQLLLLPDRGLLGGAGEARMAFAAEAWAGLVAHCPEPLQVYGLTERAPAGIEHYAPLTDPYRLLAEGRATALNLAQGEFVVQREGSGWTPWKPLLAVAGLWLLLQFSFNLGQAWYLERQGDSYAAASRALYKELFPQDRRIVNLRAQFAEHLAAGASSTSGRFLQLLEPVAGAIVSEPALSIVQLDFSETRGDLALQVKAPDFANLERLRQRLSEAGLAVQLGSANREEGGVTARVVIGG